MKRKSDVADADIRAKYEEWKETFSFQEPWPEDKLKEELGKEMAFYRAMTVEEYTLYKKWSEIHRYYGKLTNQNVSLFFGVNPEVQAIKEIKSLLWSPNSLDDYLNLEPELVLKEEFKTDTWTILRRFLSTMIFSSNIGRNMFFVVRDRPSQKYLGVIQITGDFLDVRGRDQYIGWEREYKTLSGKLNNSCIGSTIVPTQPLGYLYTGGKLLALLCCSDVIENRWQELYGDKLVSVTTTSLYGGFSQYSGLKYWKSLGLSGGSVSLEPSPLLMKELYKWIAWNHPWDYYEAKLLNVHFGLIKRDYKNRTIQKNLKRLGFKEKDFKSNFQRGIYFCELFNNTKEFLRGEIEEKDLTRRFDNSTEALVSLWKTKYAKKRLDNLQKTDRIKMESLFYDDILYMG